MARKSKKDERAKEHRWKMAARVFRLSPEHIRMAKLLGADPRTTFDGWRDRAQGRGISLATYVERRYVASFGDADPMKGAARPAKDDSLRPEKPTKERRVPRRGTRLILGVPAELRERIESRRQEQGLRVADEIGALLEARWPAGDAPASEACPSDPAMPQPAAAATALVP